MSDKPDRNRQSELDSTQGPHPILFDNVTKRYASQTALRDLYLTVPADATTAVIGPSGSGKSTLIQLINGLILPDEGRVHVFGTPVEHHRLEHLRRRIGYAVQGTGLFPHLTVEKNISLLATLANWPKPKIENRLRVLMELVNLQDEYRSKYPHQLSGGEQQRVGLCRAMMLNPRIFLLDEPFGALDPLTRSEIHREFIKLQKLETRTIVLVTHDLREAIKLADFIAILNQGRLEQMGTRDDILQRPAGAFVENFVHLQLEDDVSQPSNN
ncbi:MAG: ATP-binding cassette domain-containing protein [bacterium]